jgi:hypothetical protein
MAMDVHRCMEARPAHARHALGLKYPNANHTTRFSAATVRKNAALSFGVRFNVA